jgi:hypothetical protein
MMSLTLVLIAAVSSFLVNPKDGFLTKHSKVLSMESDITNEATIAQILTEKFVIYGYGPANSDVFLSGIGVSEKTQAGENGYFEFKKLYFPTILSHLVGDWYPELCLTGLDDQRRSTYPVCIPSLPLSSDSRKIGPILLPPTLAVSSGKITVGKQAIASGKTTPHSEVEIHLARAKTPSNIFTIVKEAFAYYIPTYQITSDSNGNFEFSLPGKSADTWKVFGISKVLGAASAKSNTLTFNVLPEYVGIFAFLSFLFALARPYLIYIVILIQIAAILLLRHRRRLHF